jgi:peptide/nickel transport system substrate-binding protein
MEAERVEGLVDAVANGRMSRRLFLKAMVGLGVSLPAALALLEGCAPPPAVTSTTAPPPTPAPGETAVATATPGGAAGPVSGGTLIFAYAANVTNMDPSRIIGQWNNHPWYAVYDGLVRLQAESGDLVEPALAESWETSEDGLIKTFHLRKGVTFHDGTPFNADAVVFTFMRIIDPNHPFHYGDMAPGVSNFDHVDKVEKVDDYTVKTTLKWPFPYHEQMISTYDGLIMCPSTFEKYGDEAFKPTYANGTGPFKLVNWVDGDRMEFERNDEYWGGKSYVDKIIMRTITEAATQLAELEAGSVHIVEGITHPRNIAAIDANPDLQILKLPGVIWNWLGFNLTKPVFADKRVRQAINYAIDRESMAKNLFQGLVEPRKGWLPQICAYFDPSQTVWPYDPEKARELLAEAGYADGFEVNLWQQSTSSVDNIVGPEMATALQGQLADVGIKAQVVVNDYATHLATLSSGVNEEPWEPVDTYTLGWGSIAADSDNILQHAYRLPDKGGVGNYDHWHDQAVSDLIDQGRQTVDPEERRRIYAEFQRIASDFVPDCPLFQGYTLYTTSKSVQDFTLFPVPSAWRWDKVWLKP